MKQRTEVSQTQEAAIQQVLSDLPSAREFLKSQLVGCLEAGLKEFDPHFSLTTRQRELLQGFVNEILEPNTGRMIVVYDETKTFAGLYTHPEDKITLNAAEIGNRTDLLNVLTHEVFHFLADSEEKAKFTNTRRTFDEGTTEFLSRCTLLAAKKKIKGLMALGAAERGDGPGVFYTKDLRRSHELETLDDVSLERIADAACNILCNYRRASYPIEMSLVFSLLDSDVVTPDALLGAYLGEKYYGETGFVATARPEAEFVEQVRTLNLRTTWYSFLTREASVDALFPVQTASQDIHTGADRLDLLFTALRERKATYIDALMKRAENYGIRWTD
jgi:hypothetical protein